MKKHLQPFFRLLAVLCAAVLLAGGMTRSVSGETPKEKIDRLTEELAATRANIENYKDSIASQKQYLEALAQEKALIDQLAETNKQELARTERELDHKQQAVAANRQVMFESAELLQERLVAIYNMNNGSTLSRMLAVDSFTELFTVTDAMQRISQHDTELLEDLSEQKERLLAQEAEIDAMVAELNVIRSDLLQQQEDLTNNIMATDASISRTEAELAAQQQLEMQQDAALEEAQAEMRAIQSRIGGSTKGDGSEFVGGIFTWPVPSSYRITCEMGAPDPNGRPHRGLDVAAPLGTPIVAVGNGTVIEATYAHGSYGHYLVIDHGDGVKTLYAHCSQLYYSAGTQVNAGDAIAAMGSTGFSTGSHLHLEVHNGGGLDNPRAWLQG